VYGAVGPELMNAYAKVGMVTSLISEAASDVKKAVTSKDKEVKSQTAAIEELTEVSKEQTGAVKDMNDVLEEIRGVNQQIQRQERVNKSKRRFEKLEEEIEKKTTLSGITTSVKNTWEEATGGFFNTTLGKLLLGLGTGAIVWNNVLSDDQKKAIIDAGTGFFKGLLGDETFEKFKSGLETLGNSLVAATTALFAFRAIAAKLSALGNAGGGTPTPKTVPKPITTSPDFDEKGNKRKVINPGSVADSAANAGAKTAATVTEKTLLEGAEAVGKKLTQKEITEQIGEQGLKKLAENGIVWNQAAKRFMQRGANGSIGFAKREAIEEAVKAAVGKTVKKQGVSIAAKKIPVVGLAWGGVEGIIRWALGDSTGAALAATSGAVSLVPIAGTAGSVGIDIANLSRDIYYAINGVYPFEEGDTPEQREATLELINSALKDMFTFTDQSGERASVGDMTLTEYMGTPLRINPYYDPKDERANFRYRGGEFVDSTAVGQILKQLYDDDKITLDEYQSARTKYFKMLQGQVNRYRTNENIQAGTTVDQVINDVNTNILERAGSESLIGSIITQSDAYTKISPNASAN
jgi:hypothetical protein